MKNKKTYDYEKINAFAKTYIDYCFFERNPHLEFLTSMKDDSEEDGELFLVLRKIENKIIATPWDALENKEQERIRQFTRNGCPGLIDPMDEEEKNDSFGFALANYIAHEIANEAAFDASFDGLINMHGKDSSRGKYLKKHKKEFVENLKK